MNPVRLLLVLVGAGSSASAAPSRISPGRLWCFSSIHAVLVTLLLAHGYELLPEISEFSTNAIPNPYTRTRIKDTCLCDLYLRLLLDVSLISMYLSTPREQKGVTFLVCDSAIATSHFAQKYYHRVLQAGDADFQRVASSQGNTSLVRGQ